MKNIFTLILLALATFCAAQTNQVKTPGVSYSAGAPNWVPVVKTASELAIDTVAKRMYLWNRNTGAWDLQGQGIDNTSGGTPPAYTPGQTDSKFAINNASPPELYAWTGSAWANVGGTIQTIDTFSVSGSVVSLSLSQDNQPAKTITLPASGITALTGDVTASGPGSAVATIATASASVRGLLSSADWNTFNGKLGGSGASGQVGFWTGAATQSGSNNLFWNNTNGLLGIGTNSPGERLHIISGAGTNPKIKIGDADLTNPFSSIEGVVSTVGVMETFNSAGGGMLHRGYSMNNTTPGLVFFGLIGSNTPTVAATEFRAGKLSGTTIAAIGSSELAYAFRNNDGTQTYMSILGSGNVGIGVSPSARLHVQGAGATSSTFTAQFHNSANNNAFLIRDDGRIAAGGNVFDDRFNFTFDQDASTAFRVRNANTGTSARTAILAGVAGTGVGMFSAPNTYTAISTWTGRGVFGTDSGLSNGMLFYTSVGAIEFSPAGSVRMQINSSGSVLIGTTTEAASAALNVTSTTKGFLPPRMTADQASAIASPAEGLMVYVTNTNATFPTKGWYGWNGAAWEKLNN